MRANPFGKARSHALDPLLLLCLLAVSCGDVAPRGLWSDPSLEPSTLEEGVVIGGVVDLTAERDLFQMQKDAEILQAAFRGGATLAWRWFPWAEARSAIDADPSTRSSVSYRLNGRLSGRQMQALSHLAGRSLPRAGAH